MPVNQHPFASETEFVRWLLSLRPARGRNVKVGIGDDAAVVRLASGTLLVLTSDLSIEKVHFRSDLHPARSVGHRAMARSLSDIAAMGAIPRFSLVSLAVSRRPTRGWVREFYSGLLGLARRFGTELVGGDTAVLAGNSFADVMVVGEAPSLRGGMTRSGARAGDQVFVSGWLGLSALGLKLLKLGRRRLDRLGWSAIRAHLYPEPQCALGLFLAEKRLTTALIDTSDGLSSDLHHLSEASGVGACLWANRLPAPVVAGGLELALHGGEDYQLLFTVSPRNVAQVPSWFRGLPLHHIGEIRRGREVVLVEASGKTRRLEPAGYDHFRKR